MELFPWVDPQPQTTKTQQIWTDIPSELLKDSQTDKTTKPQGILNEYIKIGVVALGCPPTPDYKNTADLYRNSLRVVEGQPNISNYRTTGCF